MELLNIPETQLNDICGTLSSAGIKVDGMKLPLTGYNGGDVEVETDFGVVVITKEV